MTTRRPAWAILQGYEPDEVYGVFLDRAAAEDELAKLNEGVDRGSRKWWIAETELIEREPEADAAQGVMVQQDTEYPCQGRLAPECLQKGNGTHGHWRVRARQDEVGAWSPWVSGP